MQDDGSPAPRVTGDEARRIAADVLVRRAMNSERVEFGVGSFFIEPTHPVWLAHLPAQYFLQRTRPPADLEGRNWHAAGNT